MRWSTINKIGRDKLCWNGGGELLWYCCWPCCPVSPLRHVFKTNSLFVSFWQDWGQGRVCFFHYCKLVLQGGPAKRLCWLQNPKRSVQYGALNSRESEKIEFPDHMFSLCFSWKVLNEYIFQTNDTYKRTLLAFQKGEFAHDCRGTSKMRSGVPAFDIKLFLWDKNFIFLNWWIVWEWVCSFSQEKRVSLPIAMIDSSASLLCVYLIVKAFCSFRYSVIFPRKRSQVDKQ